MQQWEYLRVPRKRSLKVGFSKNEISDWDVEMNPDDYGKDGWELVTVATYCNAKPLAGFTTDELWIFKRPK